MEADDDADGVVAPEGKDEEEMEDTERAEVGGLSGGELL